jgi:uncharacterized protein YdeI (BOF family)
MMLHAKLMPYATALVLAFPATSFAQNNATSLTDSTWTSITGTVTDVNNDILTVDYKGGLMTVEVDDFDWSSDVNPTDRPPIAIGEKVRVYGRVDKDFFETRKIEASSVYAVDRNSYYIASSLDEEDSLWHKPLVIGDLVDATDAPGVTVSGTVSGVDGRTMTLTVGGSSVAVDTSDMLYNPLDDIGLQEISKGDVVQATGTLDDDFFTNRELIATRVTSIEDAPPGDDS